MRTMIAVPAMDTMHTLFVASLLALRRDGADVVFSSSSLVYDARNQLAEKAANEGYDRLLWLDSDMQFAPDLMQRLSARLDSGLEFVTGLYFTRKAPVEPVIYSRVERLDIGRTMLEPYRNYPEDTVFPVHGCGFGAAMHTVDLLRRVGMAYGAPFSPEPGFGEDLSFCRRAEAVGAALYCDSGIRAGHVGISIVNETTWKTRTEEGGGAA